MRPPYLVIDMKYPDLVRVANTLCAVTFKSVSMNENGGFDTITITDLYCNYQETNEVVTTSQNTEIKLSGRAYFKGDISPNIDLLGKGTLTVFQQAHSVVRATRARNIDGTVNYTLLEVA